MTTKVECNETEITVNGVIFVRKDATPPISGKRAVIVVDRGWIFAGDVTESTQDGQKRIKLTRAVWVFRWESIGFDGVLRDPKSKQVQIRTVADVDLPGDSEIFRVPVSDTWGL